MNDLVKRLRESPIGGELYYAAQEAADEIERLRNENAEWKSNARHCIEVLEEQLADVTRERDEYHRALQKVAEIECIDDLWRAQEILNAMKEQTK